VLKQRGIAFVKQVREQVKAWLKPATQTVVLGTVTDLSRSKADLILENALLRQQPTVLKRQVKRSGFTWRDRLLMIFLSSKVRSWKQALLVVQPDTVLRWHRELFKRFWQHKSKRKGGNHPLAPQVIALIQRLARDNPLWGAERIHGELRKLSWRGRQRYRAQVPQTGMSTPAQRSELVDVSAQPCV
jgi:putative transposase